jgi:hypothetical protein
VITRLFKGVFMLFTHPVIGPALIVGWVVVLLLGNSVKPDRGLFWLIAGIVAVVFGGLALGKALARGRLGLPWRQEAESTWLRAVNRLKSWQL